jgi:GNAT superfamily N-acetyltransferase
MGNENHSYVLNIIDKFDMDSFHFICRTSLFKQSPQDYDPHHVLCEPPPWTEDKGVHLLLKFKGTAVATIAMHRLPDDPKTAGFSKVAVRTESQRCGHGSRLLEMAEAFAQKRNIRRLCVNADPKAAEFYMKHGFQEAVWNQAYLDEWGSNSGPPPIQLLKPVELSL